MELFVAVKFGVHYRTICGIFPSVEEAKDQCIDCLMNDIDSWHSYGVAKYLLRQGVDYPDDIKPFWTIIRDMSETYRQPLGTNRDKLWKQNPLVEIEEESLQQYNPLKEEEICQSTKIKSSLLLESRTLIP